jgi:predicted component of type VI protein secretion system
MTVGTLESNDVVVDADRVSRVHAVFERFGATWCVRDLGSRNGTFVNGGRIIGERTLHSGDEIILGRLHMLFHGPAGGTLDAGPRPSSASATYSLRCASAVDRRRVHRASVDSSDCQEPSSEPRNNTCLACTGSSTWAPREAGRPARERGGRLRCGESATRGGD